MWRKRKLFRESDLIIFRFHCAWLAVDRGGGGNGEAAAPPGPVKPDTFKFVDRFAFFRLSCFDYSDLQLFALFIFDVDFSKT